ncbi:MAG TPA: hypothetical protein VGK16_05470 [Candidatus Limnocylindrales bacterium]|jgi:hypothetical protein
MTAGLDWPSLLGRYRVPTRLATRARRAGFTVLAAGDVLVITPDSTGRPRHLTRPDFERSVPLLGGAGRGEVNEASRNSSYVEAILLDVRR